MAQDDHVIAHALGGIMNILNQLHSVVQLHDGFRANRTADGATAVCYHDIGACFRHAHGLVCVKRIRRGKQVHLMGNAHHFHFLVIPHAGLFEVGAHAAFKQADCREVLHARITDLFYLLQEIVHIFERVGSVHARQNGGVLHNGKDLARHIHHNGIRVAISQKPGAGAAARHTIPAGIVYNDQVCAAGLFKFCADTGAGARANDGPAFLDVFAKSAKNFTACDCHDVIILSD